jgi:hypothetical protein
MRRLLVTLAVASLGGAANAALFDFATLGSNNTLLANSVTVGGVTAEGFSNGASTPAPLWLRNEPNDHGLGVCSEGQSACASGAGDVNELSNQLNPEGLRLTLPTGQSWTSLWVSSLDDGGTNNNESGILKWSNDSTFASSYNSLGGSGVVERELFPFLPGTFDPTAQYLLFTNDSSNGTNNDYLVWKGATTATVDTDPRAVPEPASAALVAAALAGLAFARRRQRI